MDTYKAIAVLGHNGTQEELYHKVKDEKTFRAARWALRHWDQYVQECETMERAIAVLGCNRTQRELYNMVRQVSKPPRKDDPGNVEILSAAKWAVRHWDEYARERANAPRENLPSRNMPRRKTHRADWWASDSANVLLRILGCAGILVLMVAMLAVLAWTDIGLHLCSLVVLAVGGYLGHRLDDWLSKR